MCGRYAWCGSWGKNEPGDGGTEGRGRGGEKDHWEVLTYTGEGGGGGTSG